MASILRVFSCSFMDCSPWGKPAVILRGSSGKAHEARDCDCKLTPSEGAIQVVAQGCSLIWRLSWFRENLLACHECTPDPKKLCNVIHIYCFGVVSYAAMGHTTGTRMLTEVVDIKDTLVLWRKTGLFSTCKSVGKRLAKLHMEIRVYLGAKGMTLRSSSLLEI